MAMKLNGIIAMKYIKCVAARCGDTVWWHSVVMVMVCAVTGVMYIINYWHWFLYGCARMETLFEYISICI